ncbi:MAG TPA: prepilin-type N-terminal cleavage/methylation domain-containing protein [Candidatus Paceibacterota bacterium]|nr:prepilin-type N-terminal cleavage/methylation domain-containing protein [Candidatus Paceibacterota bacterium]
MGTRQSGGFTLIEILVILAITAIMSTLIIVYSNVSQTSVALSVEEAKISQFILQAKSLTLATYGTVTTPACGYGVLFNTAADPQTYSIFAYVPNGTSTCPSPQSVTAINQATDVHEYTQGTWQVPLTSGISVVPTAQNPDGLALVLFYPPDPTVFLSHDGATFQPPFSTDKIYLTTTGGQAAAISVNSEGQVSF